MSAIQGKNEIEINSLKENLKEMPKNMHLFSLSLRALYAEEGVGTPSDTAIKFRELRFDTRQDAIIYLKGMLPLSTKFVSSIEEYFKYYEALSYEEWCEMLPDILEETTSYKVLAQMVLEMHESILVSLKKRQDEAKIIMREFKDLQSQFEEAIEKLEASVRTKEGWAIALMFIPYVNSIACPLLKIYAEKDKAQVIAKRAESKIHQAAALVVAETLIPALSHFIDGLKKAAAFFSVMELELKTFEGKAEKGIKSPKKLYYKVMNKEAANIKSLCQKFYEVLPDVRTDFEAIPTEGTDQNFVDKWLEKKMALIEKQERSKIAKILLEVFKGGEEK